MNSSVACPIPGRFVAYIILRDWGWADFLASLPSTHLNIFRLFRMVRIIRIQRKLGMAQIVKMLLHDRAGSALYLTIALVILVLQFGGVAIIYAERDAPDATIITAADGIWWGFVTITTVGYGDLTPVTNNGRAVGMLVMILGVGLFGVLTGFLANAFLPSDDAPSNEGQPELTVALPSDASSAPVEELRMLLFQQQQLNALLLERLSEIESHLASAALANTDTA